MFVVVDDADAAAVQHRFVLFWFMFCEETNINFLYNSSKKKLNTYKMFTTKVALEDGLNDWSSLSLSLSHTLQRFQCLRSSAGDKSLVNEKTQKKEREKLNESKRMMKKKTRFMCRK